MNRTVLLVLLVAGVGAMAGAPASDAQENRFRGGIGGGVMVFQRSDNLDPNGSDRYLSNLNEAADEEVTVLPLLAPYFIYDAGAPGGAALQLTVRPPIREAGGLVVNLGATYALPQEAGSLAAGLFVAPLEEAWRNPYLVGERRRTTASPKYGGYLGWERVAGSGLQLRTVFVRDTVDDDDIGRMNSDLDREGHIYAVVADYAIALTEDLEIVPGVAYLRGDYDGASNAFDRFAVELQATYRLGRLALQPKLSFSTSRYDRQDPIFRETRDQNSFFMDLNISYQAPFGWEGWAAQVMTGYGQDDDDIDFYDTETLRLGTLLTYYF
ncbi:DUF2860 family protein [Desulfofustis limnaeus]|jgi:hypothetical protein|uniref:DUF2860 domain-containing protein n=1 Tax=Desulfofustis limnaeus TaxID=2740163 RepID=A0ABN6M625_9BACT|nr:DUF2860 family protein [Desulfofustis limnaeus]MDX9894549.1 DUF2860 family protein [Desulfofustis sp.]BDD88331.1 hypothetical protein DPPLL_26960 [Desulfofustis limnaeus]